MDDGELMVGIVPFAVQPAPLPRKVRLKFTGPSDHVLQRVIATQFQALAPHLELRAHDVLGCWIALAALVTLQSQNGRSAAFDDGLVVVVDTVEVLQRVNELLDGIDAAPSRSWVVQWEILSFDAAKTRDLGLDVTPAADLTRKLAQAAAQPASTLAGTIRGIQGSGALNLSINAAFQGARENRDVRMEAEPLLLLVDGETATVSKGVQMPIVQNSVSPYGTTTVQSVSYKPTGLQVAVTMRDLGSGQGLLKLQVALDDIVGTAIQG